MRSRWIRPAMAGWLLLALLTTQALAGQIRIDVSNAAGANVFVPSTASLNVGDHVVWVFVRGTHSATSGASCTANGTFNSTQITTSASSGTAFSWKSTAPGSIPYYCIPHCTFGMTGTL